MILSKKPGNTFVKAIGSQFVTIVLLKPNRSIFSDKILEPANFELLKKLIEKADTLDEAIMISELGTTYKRTGFQFDKRLEFLSDTIKALFLLNSVSVEPNQPGWLLPVLRPWES